MKRLTLLLVAVALLWPAAANAQLTMQMSNGWTFAFAGNVNAFWVFSKADSIAGNASNSSVRTGLLPAFATFDAKGREGRFNLGVHFGFAPQIQNPGTHDEFGAQIDMRQVYMTIGGNWGTILAGRELGLFGRQAIINDMTLYGVGAVGIPGVTIPGANPPQGDGTTLGRIGYGYIYPNFNAQVTYTTRSGRPAQLSIGLFQPSIFEGASADYAITKIPRVEAELTYNKKVGRNSYLAWVGGLWQSASDVAFDPVETISAIGGTAGIKADLSDLTVVVTGYIGKGLGTTLMFSGLGGGGVAGDGAGTELRTSDGGYVQLGYAFNRRKTTVAGSWGFSRLKANSTATPAGDGFEAVLSNLYSYTVGVYHQWTKSLKLVFEGTREGSTGIDAVGAGSIGAKQTNVAAGFMLFY